MIVVRVENTVNVNDCFNKLLRLRKESAETVFTTDELLKFWDNRFINAEIVNYIENEVIDSGYQFLLKIGLGFEDVLKCSTKAKRLYTALYLNWFIAKLVEDAEQ